MKKEDRERITRERIQAWASVVSAAGILQIGLLVWQIYEDHDRSRKSTALESLRTWANSQPPNANQCLKFMAGLNQEDFEKVANREPPDPMTKESHAQALRCLADSDARDSHIQGNVLTRKGSSAIAGRVMTALNADENVILGHRHKVGDTSIIFEQLRNAVAEEDYMIIRKLEKMKNKEVYPAIKQFLCEQHHICAQNSHEKP